MFLMLLRIILHSVLLNGIITHQSSLVPLSRDEQTRFLSALLLRTPSVDFQEISRPRQSLSMDAIH